MADIPYVMIDNYITDIVENPCDADWWAVVTLALPAVGDALELLITPVPDEVLERTIEVKQQKNARRFGRKQPQDRKPDERHRRGRKPRFGLPLFEEFVVDSIDGLESVTGRKIGPLEWFFSRVHNFTERAFFWWLVYDSVDTFFYAWRSGILESRFCAANALYYIKGEAGFMGNGRADPFEPFPWEITSVSPGVLYGPGFARVPEPHRLYAVYMKKIVNSGTSTVEATMLIRAYREGQPIFEKSKKVTLAPGQDQLVGLTLESFFADQAFFSTSGVVDFAAEDGIATAMWLPAPPPPWEE